MRSFMPISDAISSTKRAAPYPARMLFSRSIAWIGKKVITYYLKTPLFPISADLAVFRRSVTRLKTRAGAGFVRKMALKSHEKSDLFCVSQSNTKRGCVSVSPDLVTWLTSPWQWSSCRARVPRGRAWVSVFCLMLCVLTSADFQSQGDTEHLVADAFVWHVRLLRGIRFLRKFTGGRANRRPRYQAHSLLLEHMQEASTSRDEVMMSNHINLFVCRSSMSDPVRPQGLGSWPTGGSII